MRLPDYGAFSFDCNASTNFLIASVRVDAGSGCA